MNFNPSEQFVDAEGSSRPCRTRGVGDDLPVFCVGFIDALRYANALSRMEGFSPCYDEQSSGMGHHRELFRLSNSKRNRVGECSHSRAYGEVCGIRFAQ